MQHAEAVRFMASEKYLMNELTPELREEFEEHFFSCAECALDVGAAAAFIDHSKIALSQPDPVVAAKPVPVRQPAPWLAWLRPAIAVPIMALLLAVIGYQHFSGVTNTTQEVADLRTPQILPSASLVSVRSDRVPVITAGANQPFLLFVDVPAEERFTSYSCELDSPAGQTVWSLPVSADAAKNTLSLQVPTNSAASGAYNLVVKGIAADKSAIQIARYPFQLQIQK